MNWNPHLMTMPLGKPVFPVKFLPGSNGFFLGRKSSNVDVFLPQAAISYPSAKPLSHPGHGASSIVASPHISPVHGRSHFAQIAQSIVQSIAINVVDLTLWPASICNRKDDPMGLKNYSMNLSLAVALIRNWEGLFASIRSVKSTIANIFPKKTASLLVIAKEFTANFWCDIGSNSHSAVPLRSGQGRGLFAQLFRPAFCARFSRFSQGESA